MDDTENPAQNDAPWIIRSWVAPVVLIGIGLAMLTVGMSYRESAARFPTAVGGLLVVFACIDLWCRSALPGAAGMADFWGAGFSRREMPFDPPFRAELAEIGWALLCLFGMALVGILPTLPLYCGGYVWLRGGLPLRTAAMVGGGMLIFTYTVFEFLLDYDLYRGILFTPGGIAAW
jgi:hypothetical protein